MAKRTTSRRLAMQALYQAETSRIDIEEALKNIFESEKFVPETIEFAEQLAKEAFASPALKPIACSSAIPTS